MGSLYHWGTGGFMLPGRRTPQTHIYLRVVMMHKRRRDHDWRWTRWLLLPYIFMVPACKGWHPPLNAFLPGRPRIQPFAGRAFASYCILKASKSGDLSAPSTAPLPLRYWPVSGPRSPELVSLCQQHMELLVAAMPEGKVKRAVVYVPSPAGLSEGEAPAAESSAVLLAAYPPQEAVEVVGSEGESVDAKALFRVQGLSVRDRGQQVVMPLVNSSWLLGWLLVDKRNGAGSWSEEELSLMGRVAGCLALGLFLGIRKRRDEEERLEEAQRALRDTLQQIRSPLSALRTFGKLLARRLQREEGLSLELARNILTQSDRLVELISPFTAVVGVLGGRADGALDERRRGTKDDTTGAQHDESDAGGGEEDGAGAQLSLCRMEDVVAPIFQAATALAAQDGIALHCSVEEGLPSVLVDERLLQEALANVVDHSLNYVMWDGGGVPHPALRIEVVGLPGPEGEVVEVVVDVVDNGVGSPLLQSVEEHRDSPEVWEKPQSSLAVAQDLLARMQARLELASVMGERRVRIFLPWSAATNQQQQTTLPAAGDER